MKETLLQTLAWEQLIEVMLHEPKQFVVQQDNSIFIIPPNDKIALWLYETHIPFIMMDDDEGLIVPEAGRYLIEKRVVQIVTKTLPSSVKDDTYDPDVSDLTLKRMVEFTDSFEAKHLNDDFFIEEVFFSVQGEGLDIGLMTAFIRVLGCDMRCVGCDTFYGEATPKTVGNTTYEKWTIQRLLDQIETWGAQTVCVTGGEPTLYYKKLVPLAAMLRARGTWLTLQTNGKNLDDVICGLFQSVNLDIKPPSSLQPVRLDKVKHLWPNQQAKVLVGTPEDLEFAYTVDAYISEHKPDIWLVLQGYIYNHDHNRDGAINAFKRIYDMMEENHKKFKSNTRITCQLHKGIQAR
jgi:7-carboxy-7-deazaguanine synthase